MACQGEKRAFETLVTRHYGMVFKVAYKWCGNRADAEDVAQDTCIRLAAIVCSYDGRAKFTSWLYRIVINMTVDLQRKNSRRGDVSIDLAGEQGTDADAEDTLYARQVFAHVFALPEREKTALLLVMSEGMTHKEAAAVMDCKESTVSWYIHEARKRLDAALDTKEKRHG
jgi:RNA polymerase sigma-70 factor (ECF subfamily)